MHLFVLVPDNGLYLGDLFCITILEVGDLLLDDPKLFLPTVYLFLLDFCFYFLHFGDEVVPEPTLAYFLLEARDDGCWFCNWLFLKVVISIEGLF